MATGKQKVPILDQDSFDRSSEQEIRGIRVEILKILVPSAAKVGLNDPSLIAVKAAGLEHYVVNGYSAPKLDTEDLTD